MPDQKKTQNKKTLPKAKKASLLAFKKQRKAGEEADKLQAWMIPNDKEQLSYKEQASIDRKKRQKELIIAGAVFALLLVLVNIQLQYFNAGSVIFFALFNLNVVILIGIIFVLLRNGMKLLLERRRKVIGSRLRTRLTLAITSMILVPCLIMFLVTAQFIKLSIDFWFKNQVETAMESSIDLTQSLYNHLGVRLKADADLYIAVIESQYYIAGSNDLSLYFNRSIKNTNLSVLGILDLQKQERNWQQETKVHNTWENAKQSINWDELKNEPYKTIIHSGEFSDFIFLIMPIKLSTTPSQEFYLVLGEDLGENFSNKLAKVSEGVGEYRQLKSLTLPLKAMLYTTLSVLTSLIALGAVWFAFRLTREITSPITSLVRATESLSRGESVFIEDETSDELGILVQAFNRMATEIANNRQELTNNNQLLGQQNLVLDQQRRYIETVMDHIAAGVIALDADWRITTANKAACDFLGKPQQQLFGQAIIDLLPASHHDILKESAKNLPSKPRLSVHQQIVININQEERHLLVTTVGLADSKGVSHGYVVVFEDVSEMERMQKMAAWREVARRIAHEIKNPLTPIKLSAQRIEKRFSAQINDPVFNDSIKLIVTQVAQIQSMVEEFSAFAKLPSITLKTEQIAPILEEVTAMFKNSHTEINWLLNIQEQLPDLKMDNDGLQRVFINIFTNAAEALEKTTLGQVEITAFTNKESNQIYITISDNGSGITESDAHQKLFEPYFSSKKSGTGLGLAIVRSIISEHQGYVRASSNEHSGTTITIELPVT